MHALIAGGVTAAGVLTASPAAADADHTQTFAPDLRGQRRTFVPHPNFWRARCQGSRPAGGVDDGLRAPFMICTMQMAGEFLAATTDADGTTS